MNGYICTKTCKFGGVAYSVGDAIPFEAVLPSREKALIKQGFIAPALDIKMMQDENKMLAAKVKELEKEAAQAQELPVTDEEGQGDIVIPIAAKGGVLELIMAPEDIVKAVAIMQLNAEEAARAVGEIEKEETLIFIDALDARKTVKSAIIAKVQEMEKGKNGNGEEDEGRGDA